jgi:hypothetical protein
MLFHTTLTCICRQCFTIVTFWIFLFLYEWANYSKKNGQAFPKVAHEYYVSVCCVSKEKLQKGYYQHRCFLCLSSCVQLDNFRTDLLKIWYWGILSGTVHFWLRADDDNGASYRDLHAFLRTSRAALPSVSHRNYREEWNAFYAQYTFSCSSWDN